MMCLTDTDYYELEELSLEWDVCGRRLKRWLISGMLKSHFWLPVLSVVERCPTPESHAPDRLRHFEGFVPLSGQHCLRLFRSGKLTVRRFKEKNTSYYLELPETSDDILVNANDLLILESDKVYFEREHIVFSKDPHKALRIDPDFRAIEINGETHHFGKIQSAILCYLNQAAIDGEPWQNGKQLLHAVGSESFTISNVFKHKPIWRQLIESNGRGLYRLAPDFSP